MQKQAISITFGKGEMLATFVVTLETDYPCVAPCKLAFNLEAVASILANAIREADATIVHRAGPCEVVQNT